MSSIPSPSIMDKLARIALLLAATAAAPAGAESGPVLYARLAAQPDAAACVEADVDLGAGDAFSRRPTESGFELHYRMRHNDVAEGWSWPESADERHPDHFRFKYLPLGSENEERGSYQAEDQIGEAQTMAIRWRYDYFLAFPNIADFAQSDDDDAGFVMAVARIPPAEVKLRASACLEPPATRESTTFWKATHGNPVDFTLKKRYLVGKLERLDFVDANSGELLARALPLAAAANH